MRFHNVMPLVLLMAALAGAQPNTPSTASEATPPPAAESATETPATTEAPADSVVMTVNGKDIMESEVNAVLMEQINRMARGRTLTSAQIDQMMQMYKQQKGQVLQMLLDDYLVDQIVNQAEVTVTDADARQELETAIKMTMDQRGWTREEYSEMIQKQEGKTLDELLEETIKNPQFRKNIYLQKLAEKKKPEALVVTDDDLNGYYEKNRQSRFSNPEMVRASHILIKTEGAKDDAEKAALRQKAEDILKEVKAEGADFAALAAKYSECPSSANGGDLDFFTPERMVPEFSQAAFAMQPGGISDIVETQFGFHIIKTTERREAKTKSFDEVKSMIAFEMKMQKRQQVIQTFIDEARTTAKITFPEGQEITLPFQTPPPAAQPPMDPEADAPAEPKTDNTSETIE